MSDIEKIEAPAAGVPEEEAHWKPNKTEQEYQMRIENAMRLGMYEDAAALIDELLPLIADPLARTDYADLGARLRRKILDDKNSLPESKKEVAITVEKPQMRFDSIIGMAKIKKQLKEEMDLMLNHREEYLADGLAPSGILMYGAPGIGKSVFAEAAAGQFGFSIIRPDQGELFSEWVGRSEKYIKEMMNAAEKNQPCIIFLDEIDAKIKNRAKMEARGESAVNLNVTTQFLESLPRAHRSKSKIVFMAATNRIWDVDTAAKRPDRFGELLYLRLPSLKERVRLFLFYLRPYGISPLSLLRCALATAAYSHSDIKEICNKAKKTRLLRQGRLNVWLVLQCARATPGSVDAWIVETHKALVGYRETQKEKGRLFSRKKVVTHQGQFDAEERRIYKEMITDIKRLYAHLPMMRLTRAIFLNAPDYYAWMLKTKLAN